MTDDERHNLLKAEEMLSEARYALARANQIPLPVDLAELIGQARELVSGAYAEAAKHLGL
jgi:hypothetical protein